MKRNKLILFRNVIRPFYSFLLLSVLCIENISAQPPGAIQVIDKAMLNWNRLYGTNVKALEWKADIIPVIKTQAQVRSSISEITDPLKAWLPSGDIMNPAGMTAERVADDLSIEKNAFAAWQKKIASKIKTGQQRIRISWAKGLTIFSTLCVIDDKFIVYDNMFSNVITMDHHSKCLEMRLGSIWETDFEELTRGKIWANLETLCNKDGAVLKCVPDCGGTLLDGEATCICVTEETGNCCFMQYEWAYANGFKSLKFRYNEKGEKTGVEVTGSLGSSGMGKGSCAECCPVVPVPPIKPIPDKAPDIYASYRVGDEKSDGPFGFTSIEVKTLQGEVIDVRVPNHIYPGDVITASVTPGSQTVTLQGTVVQVQDKKDSLNKRLFAFTVPAGIASIPLVLMDRNGSALAKADIPVRHMGIPDLTGNTPVPPDKIQFPALPEPGNFIPFNYAQPGNPVTINGNFDGDGSNTRVFFGDIKAEIITESPVSCIALTPAALPPGEVNVSVSDGHAERTMPVQIITIDLATNSPTILKNKEAIVRTRVYGLKKLDLKNYKFQVELTVLSPGTISFTEGNPGFQVLTLDPEIVKNGTADFSTKIRGLNTGTYSISARLISNFCENCWELYRDCLVKADEAYGDCKLDCQNANLGKNCIYIKCLLLWALRRAACQAIYKKCLEDKYIGIK